MYVRLGAGYTSCMRFRVGLLAGFAVGYYLGSKAGRERYEQMTASARQVPVFEMAKRSGTETAMSAPPHR